MTTATETETKCQECGEGAAYHDTVSGYNLCGDCARRSALERMLDDREMRLLETPTGEQEERETKYA